MTNSLLDPLQRYLAERYPFAMISNLNFLTSGFESDVYSFIMQVPDQTAKHLILRLYPGEGAGQKMARESAGLVYLEHAGYPVPSMLLAEPNAAILGQPFNVMEKVEGQNLWAILSGAEYSQSGSLLNRFSALLAQLHRLDWRRFHPQSSRYETDPGILLAENLSDARQQYERSGNPEFLPIMDWLKDHQRRIRVIPAIVHMDFHANNVLLTGDDRIVVIDWTQVAVADYRADLSWTLLIMGNFGQAQWGRQILKGYEDAAGQPVEDLDYFEVISDIKLLSGMLSLLKSNLAGQGLHPEAAQSIRQQAPVLRLLLERIRAITGLSMPEVEVLLQ